MKNTVCLALIILALLPASAQKAARPNQAANGDAASGLAQGYAARVDALLREVHADLQKISAQVEARQLTPEQARDLKLAATRDLISRLDALAAIYDARLEVNASTGTTIRSVAANACAPDNAARMTRRANGTVSVEELKREAAATVAMPSAGGVHSKDAARSR
jgi:hypothetical protein